MKTCPLGHANEDGAIFCKKAGCTHLFAYNHHEQVRVVTASIGRTARPDEVHPDPQTLRENRYLN
jgi:hypothetical protein